MAAPAGPRYFENESRFTGKFLDDWESDVSYAVNGPYDETTDRFEHAARLLLDRCDTERFTQQHITYTISKLESPGPVEPDALAITRADIIRALKNSVYSHVHENRRIDGAVFRVVSALEKMLH